MCVETVFEDSARAKFLRRINPSFSYCMRCGKPWNHCQNKTVMMSEHSGSFATCDKCWDKSTLEELKKYYAILWHQQSISVIAIGEKMDRTLEHVLSCVEKEFKKTHS